jgi:hypothetical protein
MHQSNSSFRMSLTTIERITGLGASFGVDIYGPNPDDEDRKEVVARMRPSS